MHLSGPLVALHLLTGPLVAALHVVPRHFNVHADPAQPLSVEELLLEVAPLWAERAGKFVCSELSGGLTNVVIRARPQRSDCESLLVRIFGDNTDRILDREKELITLQSLASHNFSTHVGIIGTFNNGRVERYAPGRVLGIEELRNPAMASRCARSLARLHRVNVAGHDRHQPSLWRMLDRWLDLAMAGDVSLPFGLDEPTVRTAIVELHERIDAAHAAGSQTPIVFAHNDASALNLVYDDASQRVRLIDFEYSRYNYRGFDLANHLIE